MQLCRNENLDGARYCMVCGYNRETGERFEDSLPPDDTQARECREERFKAGIFGVLAVLMCVLVWVLWETVNTTMNAGVNNQIMGGVAFCGLCLCLYLARYCMERFVEHVELRTGFIVGFFILCWVMHEQWNAALIVTFLACRWIIDEQWNIVFFITFLVVCWYMHEQWNTAFLVLFLALYWYLGNRFDK